MRIIGGEFRGRRLSAPRGHGTRPTPDRVREALFNILGPRVEGALVAELFGGTGSLGLEALSRGADRAHFCETDRAALACLGKNVRLLGVEDRAVLHARSAFDLPKLLPEDARLDLVFCDPPYRLTGRDRDRERLGRLLAALPLAPDGRILFEHRKGTLVGFLPPGLSLETTRAWGSTSVSFLMTAL